MKLLENTEFEAICSTLFESNRDLKILGRLESYSTKLAGVQKKWYKSFTAKDGQKPAELLAVSRTSSSSSSCSNELSSDDGSNFIDVISRKSLFRLIATLNASFPDYDFSYAKSHEFTKEPAISRVMNLIDSNLTRALGTKYREIRSTLWTEINEVVPLNRCDVYSYTPDLTSDPFSDDGCLWSFNYFFLGRRIGRVVFFTCRVLNPLHAVDSGVGSDFTGDDEDDNDDYEEDGNSRYNAWMDY